VRVREGGRWKGEAHTELAPGAGDGSGADEVGGVVEEVEDTGGGVEADPVEEVPAAALLHLHRRRAPRAVAGGGRSQRRSRSVSKEPCWLVEERNGEARGREEEERKPTELVSGGAVAAFVQILLWCLWPPNSTDSSQIGHCFSCIQPCPGDACDATLLLSTHPPPCRGATFERLRATSNRCIISGSRSSRAPPSPTFLYCFLSFGVFKKAVF
jgi:hypothetical protein